MKQHRTDLFALLFGLAFVSVGISFLVNELTDTEVDAAWVSAIAFITLGVIALAATFLRHRPNDFAPVDSAIDVPSESAAEPAPELDATNEVDVT